MAPYWCVSTRLRVLQCVCNGVPVFMKIIGHVRHFWWLGPNVWWEVSQVWIEYIKPDEPWKFFGNAWVPTVLHKPIDTASLTESSLVQLMTVWHQTIAWITADPKENNMKWNSNQKAKTYRSFFRITLLIKMLTFCTCGIPLFQDKNFDDFYRNGKFTIGHEVKMPMRYKDLLVTLFWFVTLCIPLLVFMFNAFVSGSWMLKLGMVALLLAG